MSTITNLVQRYSSLGPSDCEWLGWLTRDWQLLADLATADLVMWVRGTEGKFIAVGQVRPSGAPTLFYRDLIGQEIREQWAAGVEEAFRRGETVRSSAPDWFDEIPAQLTITPVFSLRSEHGKSTRSEEPIAMITRHTNLSGPRHLTRQELTFREISDDLFAMIEAAEYPDLDAPDFPRKGAPRASDGLIRLDPDGVVTFASANALSAINKLGFGGELEGEVFADVAAHLVDDKRHVTVDEALPLVVTGRAPWMTDVDARGITVTLRAIPLHRQGTRLGAILLVRDTTEVRNQEQEIITKDATIREIHHRVKNNLQTVAALLRIQARRARSEEAREALLQAMRRVSSIAVVHDTLSGGFSQSVDFDEVFLRVMRLATEVAGSEGDKIRPELKGSFGAVPSEYATPLALALTELVTNAVEHGFDDNVEDGYVLVEVDRADDYLDVAVRDNGLGMITGHEGNGLGTQIVRTLVEGELAGSITWSSEPGEGTTVHIRIPKRWGVISNTGAVDIANSRST
ncbi:sensor histidine kinase [Gulosibacter sp. 10]|uniref:sensor histidine kinase n=1 Tax=Gulosibacter sp. 10 TaxID=1255570 RepID=UPI00097EF3E4|nr:PAS domain-containing sensor histidine kinase [Gulosibacter sp. 10]SJM54498.1 Serine phosphatase RsbU, regulator of sigma subunit [Gulosibacter sp. 10]